MKYFIFILLCLIFFIVMVPLDYIDSSIKAALISGLILCPIFGYFLCYRDYIFKQHFNKDEYSSFEYSLEENFLSNTLIFYIVIFSLILLALMNKR